MNHRVSEAGARDGVPAFAALRATRRHPKAGASAICAAAALASVFVLLPVLAACDTTSCTSAADCPCYACTCGDGSKRSGRSCDVANHVCVSGDETCTNACDVLGEENATESPNACK